ncbi:hypothetical protein B0H13DRAFT_1923457 [Mycena leptocephala]|nr:hypothetical protein B0H13DRAFT_1923457 [Mycena leptocephala]
MPEHPYTSSDFVGLQRDDLVAFMLRQPEKWPSTLGKFKRGKTNMDTMRNGLLNGEFTTDIPSKQLASPDPTTLNPIPSQVASSARVDEPDHSANPTPRDNDNDMSTGERCSRDTRRRIHERISNVLKSLSREILDALQESISAFKGPARIGAPNPENPTYIEFFATIPGFEYLESDIHANARLIISSNVTLNLTISAIGGARIPEKSQLPDHFEELSGWAKNKSEAMLNPPATSVRTKRKVTIESLTDGELSWIVGRVKSMPGFDVFEANQNQRLSNLARVNYWKSAAHFSAQYYKTQWPTCISLSGGNTIRKSAIEVALRMGTTALANAVNMTRITNLYYDGPHRSSEVVAKIEETGTTDSDALAKFLVQWEKDPPISAAD